MARTRRGKKDPHSHVWWNALARALGFLAVWLILSQGDLLVGMMAAAAATWASLLLLPPGRGRFRPIALARYFLHFMYQSVIAGVDVARRAFDPRLPLSPGFVIHDCHLPPGPMRNTFCTITSLIPGTLPCGQDERGRMVIHCLDTSQPVAQQLAAEETQLVRALGGVRRQ
ncbi:Na+/H+ antiporter subunit E [Nordella sp. HKS 07]|uniref:Na+/H+ antiporter subunit E n=1 Tax=Nordella sp. HKS 07 TaxID=2712222 RepID=UPI0013E1A3F0|nr:Na+/H+ antiporter subunit E [Nordella sp. HKS 07]QIG50962.1 Na+/H+ antiporter subunit E [Nordella sp. HKS 07]